MLTFFGGEPLLNLPVMYDLAERLCARHAARAASTQIVSIITNGLLLTPEVVDRLLPFGLNGVKITLDGDRETHNRMRPLRGGQGTFDRIIENIRRVAGTVPVAIGGNFDEASVDSYPALLDFLREQDFAGKLVEGQVQAGHQPAEAGGRRRTDGSAHPAHAGRPGRQAARRHLHDRCRRRRARIESCDTCHFVDDKMAFLREETRRRGFPTADGVHMGPCDSTGATPTPSAPTDRSTPARGSPATTRCRSATSTAAETTSRRRAARPVRAHSRPGTSAATARSFRCAAAAARSPRTPSLVT